MAGRSTRSSFLRKKSNAGVSETVDAQNVREVLAFVETLPKVQEKNMLVSLFVARWAELEQERGEWDATNLDGLDTTENWRTDGRVADK